MSTFNSEAKVTASQLNLNDKIEKLSKQNAFITFPDHKADFPNNPKRRLINYKKMELERSASTCWKIVIRMFDPNLALTN